MAKSFLTFQAQISFLEQDKNLLVENHTFAEAMLTQIGYFSLIGGYKTPFKNPTTQKYKDGTRFEDIVALYHAVYSIDIRYGFSTDKDAYLLKKILVCTWLLAMAKSIVGTVSHKREARDGRPGEEMTFITSLTDAYEIVETIEMRWKIENGLHRFKTLCFTCSLTKNQIL